MKWFSLQDGKKYKKIYSTVLFIYHVSFYILEKYNDFITFQEEILNNSIKSNEFVRTSIIRK